MEIIAIGILLWIIFALWGKSKSNKCPVCNGSGQLQPEGITCYKCNGIGRVVK